ncbi:MAG: copper resistance protein NlpE [Endomicrobia bacterium]|nr:copper resistance protein NlpE [Endomicrobiia bacterium]MCL2506751.1 copper resistance protein NlpE [Endomicrobiia bacterium]
MKKIKVLFILLLSAQFFVSGCMLNKIPPPYNQQQQEVSKETVKEIESKVSNIAAKISLDFKHLKGYYLRNSIRLTRDINFFVIDSQKKFDEYLGKSSIHVNFSREIDFKKSLVAAIVIKPSLKLHEIDVSAAYSIGSDIYLDYEITQTGDSEVGYFVPAIRIIEVARPQAVTNVAFVNEERKITVIPYGNRNMFSPSNMDDLKKNYTGIYKGTFPAADGPGITVNLNLMPDNTFILRQTYADQSGRTFESSGNWAPTEDLSSFVLNHDKDINEQMRFYFVDKNTIEKLDNYGERIKSEFYRLRK